MRLDGMATRNEISAAVAEVTGSRVGLRPDRVAVAYGVAMAFQSTWPSVAAAAAGETRV
jgi:hypothetical protein